MVIPAIVDTRTLNSDKATGIGSDYA
jgi:hypothetical protein